MTTRQKEVQAQWGNKEDLFIMKCFAHRPKDIPHAKALLKKGLNLKIVENRITELEEKKIPGCLAATEFLDELLAQMEDS